MRRYTAAAFAAGLAVTTDAHAGCPNPIPTDDRRYERRVEQANDRMAEVDAVAAGVLLAYERLADRVGRRDARRELAARSPGWDDGTAAKLSERSDLEHRAGLAAEAVHPKLVEREDVRLEGSLVWPERPPLTEQTTQTALPRPDALARPDSVQERAGDARKEWSEQRREQNLGEKVGPWLEQMQNEAQSLEALGKARENARSATDETKSEVERAFAEGSEEATIEKRLDAVDEAMPIGPGARAKWRCRNEREPPDIAGRTPARHGLEIAVRHQQSLGVENRRIGRWIGTAAARAAHAGRGPEQIESPSKESMERMWITQATKGSEEVRAKERAEQWARARVGLDAWAYALLVRQTVRRMEEERRRLLEGLDACTNAACDARYGFEAARLATEGYALRAHLEIALTSVALSHAMHTSSRVRSEQ